MPDRPYNRAHTSMSADPLVEAAAAPASFVCPNCDTPNHDRYCAHCGQKHIHEGDLSLAHAWHHVLHEAVHLDGRLFSTLKLLFLKPGQLTLDFVQGRRARHLGPITLFLTAGAIYFVLAQNALGAAFDLRKVMKSIQDPRVVSHIEQRATSSGMTLDAYLQYRHDRFIKIYKPAYMTAVLFGAVWLVLLFRKPPRYLIEHLVFVLHTGSFGFLLTTMLSWTHRWLRFDPFIGTAGILIYFVIAARRFYGGGAWWTLALKGLLLQVLEFALVLLALSLAFVWAIVL
jgi:uncharacterized protein DUF3667